MSVRERFGQALCACALALLGACAQTPGQRAEPGLEIAPVYRITHAKGIELAAAEREAKRARASATGQGRATNSARLVAPGFSSIGALPAFTPSARPSRAAGWALVPVSANVYELRADKDDSMAEGSNSTNVAKSAPSKPLPPDRRWIQ